MLAVYDWTRGHGRLMPLVSSLFFTDFLLHFMFNHDTLSVLVPPDMHIRYCCFEIISRQHLEIPCFGFRSESSQCSVSTKIIFELYINDLNASVP